jgi:hypothetical protein
MDEIKSFDDFFKYINQNYKRKNDTEDDVELLRLTLEGTRQQMEKISSENSQYKKNINQLRGIIKGLTPENQKKFETITNELNGMNITESNSNPEDLLDEPSDGSKPPESSLQKKSSTNSSLEGSSNENNLIQWLNGMDTPNDSELSKPFKNYIERITLEDDILIKLKKIYYLFNKSLNTNSSIVPDIDTNAIMAKLNSDVKNTGINSITKANDSTNTSSTTTRVNNQNNSSSNSTLYQNPGYQSGLLPPLQGPLSYSGNTSTAQDNQSSSGNTLTAPGTKSSKNNALSESGPESPENNNLSKEGTESSENNTSSEPGPESSQINPSFIPGSYENGYTVGVQTEPRIIMGGGSKDILNDFLDSIQTTHILISDILKNKTKKRMNVIQSKTKKNIKNLM